MKKYFLIGFAQLAFLVCAAEYSDYYKVYFQGRELSNGETIVCNTAYEDLYKDRVVEMYNADINVVNQLSYPSLNRATIIFTSTPSYEEWQSDIYAWGNPKLCYVGGDANGDMASCMGDTGIVKIPNNSYDCFNWQFQAQYVPIGVKTEYKLELKAAQGELQWNNYSYIPDTEFYVTVKFETDKTGIDSISDESDSGVEYYSLDGIKIDNPGKGFYIEKRGEKTKKIYRR